MAENRLIEIEVVTPERVVFRDRVEAIIVPGAEGYMGIWYNHAPMVVALGTGDMVYRRDGRVFHMAVSGGFFEVADNKAVVLSDTAELPDEIDLPRAREALERARRRLADPAGPWDMERARAALDRALTRIRVAEKESRPAARR